MKTRENSLVRIVEMCDDELRTMNGVDCELEDTHSDTGETIVFPSAIDYFQRMKQNVMDELVALRHQHS